MAILLFGIGLPLGVFAEEEKVYLGTPAAEAEDETIEAPEQFPQNAGEPRPTPRTVVDESEEEVADGEEGGEEGSEEPTIIDKAHGHISSGVLATARWLDSFFADPRIENETSRTRVKVRFSFFAEEDDTAEYDVKANLRLDLPVLEDKLHLLVAGDPDDEEDFQAISGRKGEQPELISEDNDFSTSLRYFLVDTLERNISLRGGVKWRNGMPTVFLEPRYRQSVPFDPWLFRFTQRLIGYTDGRTGARTTFDFERKLRDPFFFRTTIDGSWDSDEDGYFYSLSFSVFQRFSSRRVIVYGLGNQFQTRPHNHLENVALSVRYRQRILRDWLFYEVIPQVSFPDERDHHATSGILLRLEMLFGHYPTLPPPKD